MTTMQVSSSLSSNVVLLWRCDVCEQVSFADFEEACRHEETCIGKGTELLVPISKLTAARLEPTKIAQDPANEPPTAPTANAVQVHSFFAPRPKGSMGHPTASRKSTSTATATATSTCTDTGSRRPAKKTKPTATTKLVVGSNAKSCHVAASIPAAQKQQQPSTTPLAGIFSNKQPMMMQQQLIAEQNPAEFNKQKQRLENGSSEKPPHPSRIPWALRFPIPSHVTPLLPIIPSVRNDDTFWMDTSQRRKENYDDGLVSCNHPTTAAAAASGSGKLISSPSALDASQDNRDLLHEAFSDLFQSHQKSSQQHTSSTLWSQKYGHHQGVHHIVGASTKQAANTLQQWIQEWCKARQRALDRMKERQRKLKKACSKKSKQKKKRDSDDDDDGWGDDGDGDDEHPLDTVYLLTGPPASGKTGLVQALAQACHCSVLEINTTAVRSASSLKHSIQEATQSSSTSDLFHHQRQQQQQSGNAFQDSESEYSSSDDDDGVSPSKRKRKARRPTASLTIILIDEVDLIFEDQGDAGFWTALSSLAKTARCPIILTANRPVSSLASIRNLQHVSLDRPSPMECADKLMQVIQDQGMAIRSDLGPDEIVKRLVFIATVCRCDLRKALLQLQLFHTTNHILVETSPANNNSVSEPNHLSYIQNANHPALHSIVPHRVPGDKYSIITIHGAHFHSLLATTSSSSRDIFLHLGDETCRARIMDDETILALCPPCSVREPPSRRIVTVSIPATTRFGKLDGSSIQSDILPDASALLGTHRLYVEYVFLHKDEEEGDDSEEHEFDGLTLDNHPVAAAIIPSVFLATPEQGLELWNKTMREEMSAILDLEMTVSTAAVDENSCVRRLEELSLGAQYSSDSAYLEDCHNGYPLLSGACRGFGYDRTEKIGCTSTGGGKLRLNDNCRPPSEERLYSLGWKDNCFFHGTPDTYMVQPATAPERRSLQSWAEESRSEKSSPLHVITTTTTTTSNPERDEETSEDLEGMILKEYRTSEEEMFFQPQLPILLDSLPHLLHTTKNAASYQQIMVSQQLLEKHREANALRMRNWLLNLFDPSLLQLTKTKGGRPTSRELLLLNDNLEAVAITDILPILCRIGALEESFESLERLSNETSGIIISSSSRRATRRQARIGREHYLDAFRGTSHPVQTKLSSSELGRCMATALLTYQGAAATTTTDASSTSR